MKAAVKKPRSKMQIAGAAGAFSKQARAAEPPPAANDRKAVRSREGRVTQPFWVTASARVQLKLMIAEMGMTAQDACTEALNDWFAKHGKPRIA